MNKENYISSIDGLQISKDFNDRTANLMRDALKNPQRKNITPKKAILSFASIAVVVSVGAAALTLNNKQIPANNTDNLLFAQENVSDSNSESSNVSITSAAQGITIPEIKMPDSEKSGVKADMLALFVYKGRIYIQSNTAFQTDDEYKINKDDALNLRGDYLGKTKGSINEWSKQDDYATEFASTIGESDVYTLKGYDSKYRLMVYTEYEDGFSADVYDSFGGLTVTTGADYFDLLKLKNNIVSYKWESYDSWNNGKNERADMSIDDSINKFIDALYSSVPVGEMTEMFTENTDYDSQKFVYLKTNDNLITAIRLFKDGYVYAQGVGFFKIDQNAFDAFWNTLPVSAPPAITEPSVTSTVEPSVTTETTQPTSSETAINSSDFEVTLNPSVYPVGTNLITLKIKNNRNQEVWYGVDYKIEQLTGDKWETTPASDNLMFIAIAQSLPPKSEQDFAVDLSQLNPSLEAGKYRISKTINGEQFYAEFELIK